MKAIFTKDILKDTPFKIGEFTYGAPQILWWGEPVKLEIGKYCSIANGVKILLGGNHRTDWVTTYPFSGRSLSHVFPEAALIEGHPTSKGDITIGNDVWIGLDAKILSGVEIGDGAVIAAGAVVTSSVAPYEIVGGNPAKHIGFRFDQNTIDRLLDLQWWNQPEDWIRDNVDLLMSDDVNTLLSEQAREIAKKKSDLRSISKLHFEIVRGCQLRCIGCPNSTLNPKVERIEVDFFERCLNNLDVEEIGLFRLFNFGEPLLHHDLHGILSAIKRAPQRIREVEISTNAQFVKWEEFERALTVGVLTRIAVSCDGDGTPEDYERLRPPSRWGKFIEFLERAKEIRDRVAPSIRLVTRTVVDSQVAKDRWNATLVPRGWTPEFRPGMSLPEAKVSLSRVPVKFGKGPCHFVKEIDRLYVDWDGTVVPCCAHPSAGDLGNISAEKVSAIIGGRKRVDFVSQISTNRQKVPVCNICSF